MFSAIKNLSAKFWPHFEKQNGRHSQLFKNSNGALNLEIFQLASSNLHKSYMAGNSSLIVILALLYKQNGRHITSLISFNIEWGYPIKRHYISCNIAPRVLECENNL